MFEETVRKIMEETQNVTDEMKSHFNTRTLMHIGLVQEAAKEIVNIFPEYKELLERVKKHDASKFKEPEYSPYLWINWKYKQTNSGQKFEVPKDIEANMRKATEHHVLNNPHHPECSAGVCNNDPNDRDKSTKPVDASKMSDIDIAEMISDWVSMSLERKTNTAREWFLKCHNTRWTFTKDQEVLIDKLLMVFEK